MVVKFVQCDVVAAEDDNYENQENDIKIIIY